MLTWLVRVILILVLLVVVGLAAVLILEPRLDLTAHRETISEQLTDTLGRQVRLDGQIVLVLGRHAQLSLQDIRVANPAWSSSANMLSAAEAGVLVDLFELAGGVLNIERLVLKDTDISLEVSQTGEQSWDFAAGETPADTAESDQDDSDAGIGLLLERVEIENFSLVYQEPGREPQQLHIGHLTQVEDDGALMLDGLGRANALDFSVKGRAGTVTSLMTGRDIDLDLQLSLDTTVVSVRGTLGDINRLEDLDLESSIRGPSLADLLQKLGMDLEPQGDLDLALSISDLEHGFAWRSAGRLGPLSLDSQGQLERPLELEDLEFSINAKGSDLSALGRIAGIKSLPSQPYSLSGRVLRGEAGLEFRDLGIETGDTRFSLSANLPAFPGIDNGSTRLDIQVPDPGQFAGLTGIDLSAAGALQAQINLTPMDNGEEVLDARLGLGSNELTLKGPVGTYPGFQSTRIAFELSGPDLGAVALLAEVDGLPSEPYKLTGQIEVDDKDRLMLALNESNAGPVRLQAQGSLGRLPQMISPDLTVSIAGDSLEESVGALVDEALPGLPFQLETHLRSDWAAPQIVNTTASLGDAWLKVQGKLVPVAGFAGTDASLELLIPRLAQLLPGSNDEPWADRGYQLTGRVSKSGGQLQLSNLKLTGDGLRVEADAQVPESLQLAGTQLTLQVDAADLSSIVPPSEAYTPPGGDLHADVALTAGDEHLAIDSLEVTIGDASLTGTGRLGLTEQDEGSEARLTLSAPNLAAFGVIAGMPEINQPLEFAALVSKTGNGYQAQDLLLRIGEGEIKGLVTYEQRDRPYLNLVADIRQFDFRPFLPPAQEAATQDQQQQKPTDAPADDTASTAEAGGEGQVARTRLIPDVPPPLEFLNQYDIDARISGESLFYPDPAFPDNNLVREAELDASLSNGKLALRDLSLSGDRGAVKLSGDLQQAEGVSVEAKLEARDFRFGVLAKGTGLKKLPAHTLDVRLASKGNTTRELAGALNGKVRLAGGEGETVNTGLDKALGSFTDELVNAVNPYSKTEAHTRIDCTAAGVEIRDGQVSLEPGLVIRTDKIDISAYGSIDLASENIDIKFKNSPRKGIGLSATGLVNPYVKVGGTLAKPGLTLDTTSALLSGTAAVATSGISILAVSLIDRVATAANPCEAALRQADTGETSLKLNPVDAISDAVRKGAPGPGAQQQEDEGQGFSVQDFED